QKPAATGLSTREDHEACRPGLLCGKTWRMSRALLMKKPDIEEFFRRLSEAMPEPKTELEYINTYTLLVAVALSAQATDIGVNKATKELFKKVDTPEKMLKLGEAGLIQHIRTIGLYRTKAQNVIAAARM